MTTKSLEFSVVEGWEQLPEDWMHLDVADVAIDAQDRVESPFSRCSIPSPEGEVLSRWGTPEPCAPGSFYATTPWPSIPRATCTWVR